MFFRFLKNKAKAKIVCKKPVKIVETIPYIRKSSFIKLNNNSNKGVETASIFKNLIVFMFGRLFNKLISFRYKSS